MYSMRIGFLSERDCSNDMSAMSIIHIWFHDGVDHSRVQWLVPTQFGIVHAGRVEYHGV